MFYKKEFSQTALLSRETDTIIKFTEDLEFTVPKFNNGTGWYQIKDVKGDFEITKVQRNYDSGNTYSADYDILNNKLSYSQGNILKHKFYITAKIEMQEMCIVNYHLSVPSTNLQHLKFGKYTKSEFVLHGYGDLKFTYYVKKIHESLKCDIEIYIENPYENVEIQGKKGDFKIERSSTKNVDLYLSFGIDPEILKKENGPGNIHQASISSESSVEAQDEPIQASAVDESRPESVISLDFSTNSNERKLLHLIKSNNIFSDVIFITSDETKISSHRNILAAASEIFMQIFKESAELPVQIQVNDFSADTIQSALNFLYDDFDAINGKEIDVFKFAVKYGVQCLIQACCSFFEETVDPSNVCEYIQIAYSNNLKELKQKCLNVFVHNKKEIEPLKLVDLPKNILLDTYFF